MSDLFMFNIYRIFMEVYIVLLLWHLVYQVNTQNLLTHLLKENIIHMNFQSKMIFNNKSSKLKMKYGYVNQQTLVEVEKYFWLMI